MSLEEEKEIINLKIIEIEKKKRKAVFDYPKKEIREQKMLEYNENLTALRRLKGKLSMKIWKQNNKERVKDYKKKKKKKLEKTDVEKIKNLEKRVQDLEEKLSQFTINVVVTQK